MVETIATTESPSAPTADPLIELRDVAVGPSPDGEVVVDEINWQIAAGDFWILGGARASGKSDVIATASGLQPPMGGTVRLFGNDISDLKEEGFVQQRKRIGVVFKNGGRMLSHMTVAENVALPLRYHHNLPADLAQEAVEKILEATGLSEFAHNTAGMLSALWRQRVGLARALVMEPEVLFLDEPLSGGETREQNWWLDFVEKLFAQPAPPSALIVASNGFQPWLERGTQFAAVKNKRWRVLGGRAECRDATMSLE